MGGDVERKALPEAPLLREDAVAGEDLEVANEDAVAHAAAETALSPQELLALIHRIEGDLGRERRERWGPRVIDIDILTYGDAAVDEPGLTIPHPRLTERAFVLVPLAEIAGGVAIAGKTVREWAEAIDRSGVSPLSPRAARSRNPG